MNNPVPADSVAARAAQHFTHRDQLAAALAAEDKAIKGLVAEYSQTMRVWGFTPLMLRKACQARGFLAP